MEEINIISFYELIQFYEEFQKNSDLILYRGQPDIFPLLPSIARLDNKNDTTNLEKTIINELKRRISFMNIGIKNDWDLLVYSQHFGLKTRLLDWTTNPLVALFFSFYKKPVVKPCIYMLEVENNNILSLDEEESPFDKRKKTRVFKPNINNERLRIQSGWFTAHKFSVKSKEFVPLERNRNFKNKIKRIIINNERNIILKQLNHMGISYEKLFPDYSGICNQLNYEYSLE